MVSCLDLLSSSMVIAWQRAIGGQLKSDLRFSEYGGGEPISPLEVPRSNALRRYCCRKVYCGVRRLRSARVSRVSLAEMCMLCWRRWIRRCVAARMMSWISAGWMSLFGATRRCFLRAKRLEILLRRYQELTAAEEAAKLAKKPSSSQANR